MTGILVALRRRLRRSTDADRASLRAGSYPVPLAAVGPRVWVALS